MPPPRLRADGAGDRLMAPVVCVHEPGKPLRVGVTVRVSEDKNVASGALGSEVARLVREEPPLRPDESHLRESADNLRRPFVQRAIDDDDLEISERLRGERAQAALDRRVRQVGGKDNGCCRHAKVYFLASSSSTATNCSPESPGPIR